MNLMPQFIATLNRTGSSWLTSMLNSTGIMGTAAEMPNDYRDPITRIWDLKDYWSKVKRENLTPDVNWVRMINLEKAMKDQGDCSEDYSYVWLRRINKWAQCLSGLCRQKIPLEERKIIRGYNQIVKGDRRWANFFDERGIQPLIVHYEDLLIDPEFIVRKIIKHFGYEYDGSINTTLKKRKTFSQRPEIAALGIQLMERYGVEELIPLSSTWMD